jgi:hypothetical protein
MKLFPDDLLYSQEHVWSQSGGDLTIGSRTMQEKLGESSCWIFPKPIPVKDSRSAALNRQRRWSS